MMDIDTRLKALTRLARSPTDGAKTVLQKEVDQVERSLTTHHDYDLLRQNLSVLDAIGYRFSTSAVSIVEHFISTIEGRELDYSEQEKSFVRDISKYKNAHTLIVQAIEVLGGLRYLETSKVFQALLRLTAHISEKVRRKALDALDALAGYNIDVFYGYDRQGGIGAKPQMVVIDELDQLSDLELKTYFQAILGILRRLLSPTMESTSWSYKTITFSRGVTPLVPDVSQIRFRSIQLLKRIYSLASTISERLATIDVLHGATGVHGLNTVDEQVSSMIMRDTSEVLAFYGQLIETADLQSVQRIESHSYWIYFHAHRDEIKAKAREIERAIADYSEYQIYRVLVGFDGIFGDWSEVAKSERNFGAIDEMRRRRASQFAASITVQNYEEWRRRILAYAKTESDDLATFPTFYHFLEKFAKAQPTLALTLVSNDAGAIDRFLIPLLRGLWEGPEQSATRAVIEAWVDREESNRGRHLFSATKLFLSNEKLDIELLKRLLARAAELKDLATVRQVVAVAITNYRDGQAVILNDLFLPALAILTQERDATWIFDAWFRREVRDVFAVLDDAGIELILQNLRSLPKIDYHAEEVLCPIAERKPENVLSFLRDRINIEIETRREHAEEFEAVPFEFHKLRDPLARVPHLAVRLIRELFEKDGSLFAFRGGRLLKNLFPTFSLQFEAELLKLVRAGGDANYSFVVGVLRNYEGEVFIHQLCKEIVRSIPADSPLRTEVAIALETTGVVSGEFGFVEVYERKRREVLEWLTDPDERVQEFAKWYITTLEHMRDAEQKRAEENVALRKFRYGNPES
jgi:hypothetical protein